MVLYDYFDLVENGIEFLIAIGSIIGLLGVIVGVIFLVWGNSRIKAKMIGVLVISFILLTLCGLETGLRYFHVYR
jgi:hypothetical protein